MRLTSRLKADYRPLPLQAFGLLHKRLKFTLPTDDSPRHYPVIDPCAGEGNALAALMKALHLPETMAHSIELDVGRGEQLRQTLPTAEVVAPCSVFDARIPFASYSLLYLNPPMDQQTRGVRIEEEFLAATYECLVPGGVLLMACSSELVKGDVFREIIAKRFESVAVIPFEPEYRKVSEVMVIGTRRQRDTFHTASYTSSTMVRPGHMWAIPPARPPHPIVKTFPTEEEVLKLLASSPANKLLEHKSQQSMNRPPLALGIGHLALLLSAGHLDGIVCPEGEEPHVVRGVAKKVEEETENETIIDGKKVITKKTFTERIKLVVRVARTNGDILTIQE